MIDLNWEPVGYGVRAVYDGFNVSVVSTPAGCYRVQITKHERKSSLIRTYYSQSLEQGKREASMRLAEVMCE